MYFDRIRDWKAPRNYVSQSWATIKVESLIFFKMFFDMLWVE